MTKSPSDERSRVILRSEPFGGIVADMFSSNVRFYNHTAFFLVEQLLSGVTDEEILAATAERFRRTENQDIRHHIAACRSDLEHFLDTEGCRTVVDDTEDSVPALKAPLDLQLEITKRCNLSCAHCYNRSEKNAVDELPWEYLCTVLEALTPDRLRFVSVTGGEPLLHPHLERILQKARAIGESVNLSTNGTLISDRNLAYIVEYVDTMNISLDAPNSRVHDLFRNQAGSFEKARRAIRRCAIHGIKVVVQTTVFRDNLSLLKDLGRLVQDEGAGSWSVRLPLASGRALHNSPVFFSAEEIRERESELTALHEIGWEMKVFAGIPVSWSRREPFRKVDQKNPLIACTAGSVMATVLASRSLSPCILFSDTDYKEPMPDPCAIKRLWRDSPYFNRIRRMHLHDIPLCRQCGHFGEVCGAMCRAKSYLFHGDIATPDPDCDYYRSYRRAMDN